MDYRRWDKKVDPVFDPSKPASWATWHLKAVRWLSAGHQTMDNLLEKVLLEERPLTEARERELLLMNGVTFPLEVVNRVLADGICETSVPSVGQLCEALGRSRGLELYRHIYVQAKGMSPQIVQSMVARYLRATRCASLLQLQGALVAMRLLDRDIRL